MRLLVLGGTAFLGRAIVESALDRGHDVTLFNRGKTNPHLFDDVEKIHGDRTEDVSSLANRTWDAVVDVATFVPRVVRMSTDVLRDSVERYVYVSSISAYADLSSPNAEDAPLAELADPESERVEDYGPLKAASEHVAQLAFGDRCLVVRPGLIVGPHDPTDRFTYWPRRVAQGGRVLAPAPPDGPVQVIDARDLGDWIVHATENGEEGVFNATGLPTTFERLLDECVRVSGSDAEIVWVESRRLLDAGVGEWMELPLWIASPEYAAMQAVPVAKAVTAGLTFRPLAETIRDTLEWDRARETQPATGVGLAPERERELLAQL